jgi:hypothetical protein
MHVCQKPLLGQLFAVGSMSVDPVAGNQHHDHEPFVNPLTKEV